MFLSITMPRGIKNTSIKNSDITNKGERRALRLGQSLGIVLVKKPNAHR